MVEASGLTLRDISGLGYSPIGNSAWLTPRVDVNYVLSGNAAGRMDPLEAMLLASFRAASDEVKAVVIAALGAARPKPKPKPAPRAAGTVFKRATIGQQISGDVSQKGMVIKVAGDASKKKKRN